MLVGTCGYLKMFQIIYCAIFLCLDKRNESNKTLEKLSVEEIQFVLGK